MMDERKRRILQAIVQDYIATAEPVGSRTVARRYLSQLSAATIRNEMADLEEMGLLEQPHTSAGRIPSDKGYRYYVDHLLEDPVLAKAEILTLRSQLTSSARAMEEIIQQTSNLLSSLTNYVALISGPSAKQSSFYRLQLVEVGLGQAVAVLVTDSGLVANRMIQVPRGVDQKWLNSVSEFLSSNLHGRSLQQLANEGMADLRHQLAGQIKSFEYIFDFLMDLLRDASLDKLYLGGTTQILSLPEFQDLGRTRSLLALVEDAKLLQVLSQSVADSLEGQNKKKIKSKTNVQIHIGSENPLQEVEYLSIVSSAYSLHGRPLGYLGVLGPTRMDYARVVAVVREVSALLSEALESIDKN